MDLAQILTSVQISSATHHKYVKELKDLLQQAGVDTFYNHFKKYLLIAFNTDTKVKNPFLERYYDFCIYFIDTVDSKCSSQESEFVGRIFDFVLQYLEATSIKIRYHACKFVYKYTQHLIKKDKTINEDLLEKITEAILDTLEDTNPQVRAISANILKYSQGPEDTFSSVLIDNLSDTSGKVRAAIVDALIPNTKNLSHIVGRCRDVDEQVRITVFKKAANIPVQMFSIEQRQFLLKNGLKDRCERVTKCLKFTLIPSWLKYYECDYIKFLKAVQLDSDEKEISSTKEVSGLILKSLFSTQPIQEILEALFLEQKLIPFDQLTWESVLFWKHLIIYLKLEKLEQYWELIIPETVFFCEYIEKFCSTTKLLNGSKWEQQIFLIIFHELLCIAFDCDITDEASRRRVHSLLVSTLKEKKLSEEIIYDIVKYFNLLISNVEDRINFFCEIISDIRTPLVSKVFEKESNENDEKKRDLNRKLQQLLTEKIKSIENQDFDKTKEINFEITATREIIQTLQDISASSNEEENEKINDPDVIMKCLDIISALLKTSEIKSLTPALKSLKQELFTDLMTCNDTVIQGKYLRCYGAICCLDEAATKENIQFFCLPITLYCKEQSGDANVIAPAIDCIGDLLLIHGTKILPIHEEEKDSNKSLDLELLFSKDETTLTEIINYISLLLDDQNTQIRHSACEALVKLMVSRRIESPALFSRFFLKWMSPATVEDIRFRQIIGVFIEMFSQLPDVELQLEESVIPTLLTISQSPVTSPLSNVSKEEMLKSIIKIINLRHDMDYNIHENLAMRICVEIQKDFDSMSVPLLVRALLYLELYRDDEVYIGNLLNLCEDILIDLKDRTAISNMKKFIFSLKHE